jgi:hypothetical protein
LSNATQQNMSSHQSSGRDNVGLIHQNEPSFETRAVVFGGNCEISRAVIEGLKDYGRYDIVYAVIPSSPSCSNHNQSSPHNNNSNHHSNDTTYLKDGLDATILTGDTNNPEDVRKILLETKATAVFLVTATELPVEIGAVTGYNEAANHEYEMIQSFFHTVLECYQLDQIARHIVFAIRDNVHDMIYEKYHQTNNFDIIPLDDGSIVPHYSAKGKGGEYALQYLRQHQEQHSSPSGSTTDIRLTLITLPFLFSNFLGFFAPLPTNEKRIQWTLTACFGDGHHVIDMMSSSDLSYIVRK